MNHVIMFKSAEINISIYLSAGRNSTHTAAQLTGHPAAELTAHTTARPTARTTTYAAAQPTAHDQTLTLSIEIPHNLPHCR